jgi:ABC-type glycerol-3-phosphate transport system permease component
MADNDLSGAAPFKRSRRTRARELSRKLVLYLLAISLSLVLVFPLFWMVSTSLKTDEEANAPKPVWVPAKPQLDAYAQILSDPDWRLYIANSVFVSILAVGGTLASVTIVAFAFSRLEWPGRNLIFFLMLSTLMLPMQATLVPQYVLFNQLEWINTFNPITIPGYFAGGAAMVFLLRQFMLSIPRELDEAALVDGASYFQIFWHVILPNSKPALTTVGLFLFVGHWNSLQLPLIYLQKKELQTLPMAILNLYNPQQTRQPWTLIMATSLLAVVPLLVVFLLVQRYFVESIVLTGTKG